MCTNGIIFTQKNCKALILFEKSSIFVVIVNGFTSKFKDISVELFENARFVCYTILWILLMLYYLISSAFFFEDFIFVECPKPKH